MFENVNILFVGGFLFLLGLVFLIIGLVLDDDVSTTTTSATTSSTSSSSTMSTSSTTTVDLTPAEAFSAMRDAFESNLATGFTMGSGNGGDNFEFDFAGNDNVMTLSMPAANLNLNDVLYIEYKTHGLADYAEGTSGDRVPIALLLNHGTTFDGTSTMAASFNFQEDTAMSGTSVSWSSTDVDGLNDWNGIDNPLAINYKDAVDVGATDGAERVIGVFYIPTYKTMIMYTNGHEEATYEFMRTSVTSMPEDNQVTSWPGTDVISDMYASFGADFPVSGISTVNVAGHSFDIDINLGQKDFSFSNIIALLNAEIAATPTLATWFPDGTLVKNYLGETIGTVIAV